MLASLRSCVGTFIAIDSLLNQCTALDGVPNIDEVVRQMRLARNYMVQTEMQFVFVYRTLLDALTTLLEVENAKVRSLMRFINRQSVVLFCSFFFFLL
jgi:protein tyrosine phosphatase